MGLMDMMNAPDPVQLRRAQTYADWAKGVNPYASQDVATTDAAMQAATQQAQANTLRDIMLRGGPSGSADRMAYGQDQAMEQALAKRMMADREAKQNLYGQYLGQLSREDQARNAVAQAQTQAANQYAGMFGNTLGALGGFGMGLGQHLLTKKARA